MVQEKHGFGGKKLPRVMFRRQPKMFESQIQKNFGSRMFEFVSSSLLLLYSRIQRK